MLILMLWVDWGLIYWEDCLNFDYYELFYSICIRFDVYGEIGESWVYDVDFLILLGVCRIVMRFFLSYLLCLWFMFSLDCLILNDVEFFVIFCCGGIDLIYLVDDMFECFALFEDRWRIWFLRWLLIWLKFLVLNVFGIIEWLEW